MIIYSVGNFVVCIFINGGIWYLEVQNRILDVDILDMVEYVFILIVYDKLFYRNLFLIFIDFGGLNMGIVFFVFILD